MNGTAWVVAVANDDVVDKAVNSGQSVRQANAQRSVLALVSNKISKACLRKLEAVFDLVIVKDLDVLSNRLCTANDANSGEDSLLIAALSMTTFSKLVIMRPGFLMLKKSNQLFEENNVAVLDSCGNWEAVIFSPDKNKHAVIQESIGKNGLTLLSRPSDVLNMIFSDKWKRIPKTLSLESDDLLAHTLRSKNHDTDDWVAIVGMACRFPNANSPAEYWDLLAAGENTSSSPPTHRKQLVDMDPEMRGNFLKCPIDQFDAGFFGLSPSEATFTDPQARLLLEVSWEALEDAAINPEQLKGSKAGVFYGSWLQDYRDAMNADGSPPNEDFIRKYIGNSFGCSAAKLSFFYGLTGPNISTESGCSSSMVAVDLALQSLQREECPVAMVAGANVLLYMGMKQKVLWAEDGKSRTFDASANGYARAEGVAVLILKRYSDAKKNGDKIHALITGSAVSQEGLSKSFGTPTVESECHAMKAALAKAKVEPWEVDYVEAHATGTAVGDPIEAQAIVKAYSAEGESKKHRDNPLYIGSGKTNIGHTESCSGMAGIFKVILALQNELIPKHLNVDKINPQVNFDSIPGVIPVEAVPWHKKKNGKRIGGVSSFGITGTDVHIIIQEAPEEKPSKWESGELSPAPLVLAVSAKSESALEEFAKLYANYLEDSTAPLENITYTANVCRPHHPFRMAVLGRTKQEMRSNLVSGMCSRGKATTPKICFTFPGRIGLMDLEPARILYSTSTVFKNAMDHCNELFEATTGGKSLLPLVRNHDEDTVAKGVTWYALILGIQYSLVKLWASWGIHPDCVMGHCIGEISAAVVSGALPLQEVFKLVTCIDYFLQIDKEQPALMMAVQASVEKVEELISLFMKNNCRENSVKWIDVASCNAFDQTVIAGDAESISHFKNFLASHSYRCKVLVMDFCAHSRAVESACQQSLPLFQGVRHQKTEIPYVSSVTGKVVRDEELNGQYWYRVFRQCVKFTESCRTVSTEGLADLYIEMGLEGALSRLTQENLKALNALPPLNTEVCLPSLWKVKGDKCWLGLAASLGQIYTLGGNVNWEEFHNVKEIRPRKVSLPNYPFQRKSFWFERRRKRAQNDFDCMPSQAQIIHPLLGAQIETCLEDVVIFENWICDNCPEIKYLYDHVIGTKVIFPGAGFLEMIVAAVASGENGNSSIEMEDFVVSSPLHLESGVPKRVQCRLDKREKTGSVYSCYKDNEGRAFWKLHARGVYELDGPTEEEKGGSLNEIMKRVEIINGAAEQFYLSAQNVGLEFGPDFRSMHQVFQNGEETLVEVVAQQTDEAENYVCHPILVDAMFQGFILHAKPDLKRLHVPVRIGKFSVEKLASQLGKFYVHSKASGDVHLLDPSGKIVASMKMAELVATSVESVLKAAGCQTAKQPEEQAPEEMEPVTLDQFLVSWQKSRFHQTGSSIPLECSQHIRPNQLLNALEAVIEKGNLFSDAEQQLDNDMNKLCRLYVLKALFDLGCQGWEPGSIVPQNLNVLPGLVPAYNNFLSYIENDILEEIGGNYDKLGGEISKLLQKLSGYAALETVQACGSQLAGILRGTVSPHGILFGTRNSSGDNLAELYYKNTRFAFRECLKEVFTIIHEEVQQAKTAAGGNTIRILEVGGGSGGFASGVLDYFAECSESVKYEYTFTDISPSFVGRAKDRFPGDTFVFKVANLEQDLLQQGLSPEYFDIVVAVDVLHATRNVKAALGNLERVTKPGGFIILKETEKPVKEVDICFGILEGYWLFEDGIRNNHCTLNGNQWLQLLTEHGFAQSQSKFLACNSQMSVITAQKQKRDNLAVEMASSEARTWLVFSNGCGDAVKSCMANKMGGLGRQVEFINLREKSNLEQFRENRLEGVIVLFNDTFSVETAPNPRSVLEALFRMAKLLVKMKSKQLPRFHLVTFGCANAVGEQENEVHAVGNPDASLAWGFLRNLRIELPGIHSKTIDADNGTEVETFCEQILGELWLDDKETEVAFRGDTRYVRRTFLREVRPSGENDLEFSSKFYSVELPKSKMIADVGFVEVDKPRALAPDEILVEVKSVSLNFKDVLAVMKPSPDFEQLTSLGLDFAGVVVSKGSQVNKWAVGQPVFGCGWEEGAMRSHVIVKENSVVAIPKHMTFQEAATLPAVWITAWYCITLVAQIQKGQTILVHAASGGVGLIAIQIAKMLGARVIGTAGTEKKRSYLRRLGIDHVFNSRTTEFAQQIQQVTSGQGVDMVLNCLTGPGFKEASLEICKDEGHFVEISKLDIWTPAQVQEMRPKVNYTVVDATQVDKELVQVILAMLREFLNEGRIKPLPYTQFPASDLKSALLYLQKAKQIGKVIVTMPQWEEKEYGAHHLKHYLFNDKSSYLITGGKGAIGLSVAKWMVTQGAKYFILVGRSPASQSVKKEIENMERDYGAVVTCREVDISDYESCRNLVQEFVKGDFPPLRGIHHCAGALSDKLLSQHDNWSSYEVALPSKVQGAWYLHQLTIDMSLEFFVLYSSAASTFGNIGQSNYTSANCYLDSLAAMRVAMGLPCLAINWGQWNMGIAKNISVDWLHPFTAREGTATLEQLMTAKNPPGVVAGLFDLHGLLRMTPYYRDTFLETVHLDEASFFGRGASKSGTTPKSCNEEKSILLTNQFQAAEDESARARVVKDFVIRVLCETLGTKPDEVQDHDQHFSEMGMDSLMSIEFANKLNSELETASVLDLEECGTVNKLSAVLLENLAKLLP